MGLRTRTIAAQVANTFSNATNTQSLSPTSNVTFEKLTANVVTANVESSLANTGVTAGTYGNTTSIPNITIDAKGRITNATTSSVSGVTGLSFTTANNTLTVSTSTTNYTANIQAGLDQAYTNATSYTDTVASTKASLSGATFSGAVSGITTLAAGNTTITGSANVTANLTANNVRTYGSVQIDGDLTVSGNTVTVNATNLSLEDNMIYLNANNTVSHPDLGFAGNYNDGTYRHAGIFRDATDARWKFYDQYVPEPDASAYIDTANNTFRIADIQANVVYGVTFTGVANTANVANSATYFGGQLAAYYANATAPGTAYSNAIAYAAANSYVNTQLGLKASLSGATFTGPIVSSSSLTANGTGSVVSIVTEQEWGYRFRMTSNTTTNRATFLTQRSLGTTASPTTVTSGTLLGGLSVGGYDGTNWVYGYNGGAEVVAVAAESWSNTARGAHLTFYTSATGSTSVGERLRITASGAVGIGNTNPSHSLSINGNLFVQTPFIENATAITANYTVAANTNAMSAGPITIADGVTVTVSDGSTWTVV